jgi:hypothetical protein
MTVREQEKGLYLTLKKTPTPTYGNQQLPIPTKTKTTNTKHQVSFLLFLFFFYCTWIPPSRGEFFTVSTSTQFKLNKIELQRALGNLNNSNESSGHISPRHKDDDTLSPLTAPSSYIPAPEKKKPGRKKKG